MGNCLFRGPGEQVEDMVKVVTSNGGIMELYAPITAECITNEFPGHAIFRSQESTTSPPLLHNQHLHGGEIYYLLPLTRSTSTISTRVSRSITKSLQEEEDRKLVNDDADNHLNMMMSTSSSILTPYRMSFHDYNHNPGHGNIGKRTSEAAEVFPRYNSTGVWKVRLVINPEQLSEILSQDTRTEALIESVRTVAKCGTGTAISSMANSDPWSTGHWQPR